MAEAWLGLSRDCDRSPNRDKAGSTGVLATIPHSDSDTATQEQLTSSLLEQHLARSNSKKDRK
jgi:hypothetical protein